MGGTAYSELVSPTSIFKQENALQANLVQAFSQLRFFLPTMTQILCQLDIKLASTHGNVILFSSNISTFSLHCFPLVFVKATRGKFDECCTELCQLWAGRKHNLWVAQVIVSVAGT